MDRSSAVSQLVDEIRSTDWATLEIDKMEAVATDWQTLETDETETMAQVTAVSQLSDIQYPAH